MMAITGDAGQQGLGTSAWVSTRGFSSREQLIEFADGVFGNQGYYLHTELLNYQGLYGSSPVWRTLFQFSTLLAIIIGIVGGLSEREIVNEFMAGAGDMMSVVMVIALARGVSVLMSSTGLDMFVLAAASNALAGTSGIVFSIGSYILYFVLSFLIPSTSGMAGVSMPIMGPLAQTLGFSPSVMVMVFCAASGVVNLITPTSGAIMGGLALSRVEYTTWVKFCTKIIIVLSVVCMIVLSIAFMVVPA